VLSKRVSHCQRPEQWHQEYALPVLRRVGEYSSSLDNLCEYHSIQLEVYGVHLHSKSAIQKFSVLDWPLSIQADFRNVPAFCRSLSIRKDLYCIRAIRLILLLSPSSIVGYQTW